MTEAFFVAADGTDDRFVGQEACVGPWSSRLMHGGPPSALLVRACERAVGAGGDDLTAVRTSVDFLSAVPLGDVDVSARVVRDGRRITLTEAVLHAGGREVLHARTWHVRRADLPELHDLDRSRHGRDADEPADEPGDRRPADAADWAPPPHMFRPAMSGWTFPYALAMEWRHVSGDPEGPGDAAVWSRARIPVLAGEEPTGLQRAVLSADSGSGLSAALDWGAWSFLNIDLDVHLSRPLHGEWVLLAATSRYERSGTGLARSDLYDEHGPVGCGAQTLLVSPRDGGGR